MSNWMPGISIQGDPTVPVGGYRFESAEGEVLLEGDAMDSALDRLEKIDMEFLPTGELRDAPAFSAIEDWGKSPVLTTEQAQRLERILRTKFDAWCRRQSRRRLR